MKKIFKYLFLAVCGGSLYVLVEFLWRSYSHWTMFLLGGLCFVLIGLLNEMIPWNIPLILQGFIGSFLVITPLEFLVGCIVNLILKMDVWDYSNIPFNIMGQICLPFSILWIVVAIVAVVLDDFIRWIWFNEEKPHYKLFKF